MGNLQGSEGKPSKSGRGKNKIKNLSGKKPNKRHKSEPIASIAENIAENGKEGEEEPAESLRRHTAAEKEEVRTGGSPTHNKEDARSGPGSGPDQDLHTSSESESVFAPAAAELNQCYYSEDETASEEPSNLIMDNVTTAIATATAQPEGPRSSNANASTNSLNSSAATFTTTRHKKVELQSSIVEHPCFVKGMY